LCFVSSGNYIGGSNSKICLCVAAQFSVCFLLSFAFLTDVLWLYQVHCWIRSH
jgi:hypothetical protein